MALAQASATFFPNALRVEAGRPSLSAITLAQAGGKAFSFNELRGKWVWLYLGFANCPGVCPITMDYLGEEYKRLKASNDIQVLFVSVDPCSRRAAAR